MQKTTVKQIRNIAIGALFGTVLGTVGLSFADGLRSTSTITSSLVIPYTGHISLDSVPMDSSNQKMRFSLYDSPTPGSGTELWKEEVTLGIYQGRFSVGIGRGAQLVSGGSSFEDIILDGEQLFVEISVEDASSPGDFVTLEGRQAIEAAPYAAWSANAADFTVAGGLEVANGATITGVDNSGVNSAAVLKLKNGSQTMVLDGNEIDSSGILYLQNNSGALTQVGGELEVAGALAVDGAVSLGGALTTLSTASIGGKLTASNGITASNGVTASGDMTLTGVDNNGTVAALKITSGGQNMLIDGNEIDTDAGILYLQNNSGGETRVGGDLNVIGKILGLDSSYDESNAGNAGGVSGTKTVDLINTADGFCYLSGMKIDHNQSNPDTMECRVRSTGTKWTLSTTQHNSAPGNFTDVGCWAVCIRY